MKGNIKETYYYIPELELEGTAEELYIQARNCYIERPEALCKLHEILNGLGDSMLEKAEYVKVLWEIATDKKELPYVFPQMKKDILDGVCPEECTISEGTVLSVVPDRGNIIISIEEMKKNGHHYAGGTFIGKDTFLQMDAAEFTNLVNSTYAYCMQEDS